MPPNQDERLIQQSLNLAERIHGVIRALCVLLLIILFCGQISMVVMRYLLGIGFLELQDSVTYAFASLVALTIPIALSADRHVRVDIFRSRFRPATNRRLDQLGHLFFTLPVFCLLLVNGWPIVFDSWLIMEGSRETGGLGGLFLVKSTLILMGVLILMEALVQTLLRPSGSDSAMTGKDER